MEKVFFACKKPLFLKEQKEIVLGIWDIVFKKKGWYFILGKILN